MFSLGKEAEDGIVSCEENLDFPTTPNLETNTLE
jgi:hypothetical protein